MRIQDSLYFWLQLSPSLTKTFLVTAKRMNALLCIRKCVFALRQADFHPITPVSSSWVFSSDRVIMPGECAARRDLANDQKGPFHKHGKGTAQQRSRVRGVTLLLHLSSSDRQACRLSGESDCSSCFQTELVKTVSAFFLLNSCITRCQTLFLVFAPRLIFNIFWNQL